MPTLRSQYQHVKQEFIQAELTEPSVTLSNISPLQQDSSPVISALMTASPSKDGVPRVVGSTSTTREMVSEVYTEDLRQETNGGGPVSPISKTKVGTEVTSAISPVSKIINVSSASSDEEPSLTSTNSSQKHDWSRGSGRKGNKKKNSRTSTSSRKSRRSSGSVCETDLLNTATVHCTAPSQSDASIYSSSSLPTMLSQSDYSHFPNFQTYKLSAEQAIMQSLHVHSVPPYESYETSCVNNLNHPVYNQSNYISLLMESRPATDAGDQFTRVGGPSQVGDHFTRVDSSQVADNLTGVNSSQDANSDDGLSKVLEQNGCFETKEGMQDRAEIVGSLDLLAKQWIRTCGLEKGFDYTVVEKNQGMVLTYGSCKLEAADREADMDLICIAPHFVTRDEFFNKMYKQLQKHACVQELRKLPDVFVPVIKFKFNNTEVDFTFARLNRAVPCNEDALLDDAYTRGLDDRCLRSLNGYRATCQILTLVPDVRVFQLSLRAIKLWGKNNGVYGNILGYLGGASWAILVARTCQEQAKQQDVEHCPKEVIFTFFSMYSNWKWPAPVYISLPRDEPSRAWNPSINAADRDHCMPIITSSAPQMNSAVNINHSVQKYIQERMKEANHVCHKIQAGTAGWEALFKAFPFYQEYEEYIRIRGECETDACFWFGCLESKLRYLKEKIESHPRIKSVRIWPKGFISRDKMVSVQQWFIGIAGTSSNLDLESYIEDDLSVFKDRCYGDLKRAYGGSSLGLRGFHVTYKLIQRGEIFQTIPLKDLKKSITYASVTQGLSSSARAATPPVLATSNQKMSSLTSLHGTTSQHFPSHYQSTNTQSLGSLTSSNLASNSQADSSNYTSVNPTNSTNYTSANPTNSTIYTSVNPTNSANYTSVNPTNTTNYSSANQANTTNYPSVTQASVSHSNVSNNLPSSLPSAQQGHSSNTGNHNSIGAGIQNGAGVTGSNPHSLNPLANHAVNMAAAAGAYAAATYPFHLPYPYQFGLYHTGEALSPKLLLPNSRTHSPRSGSSSRNQSPSFPHQHNSPNHFVYPESGVGLAPFLHSPSTTAAMQQALTASQVRIFSPGHPNQARTYSPGQHTNHAAADRNYLPPNPLGPFSFPPPPVRQLVTTPPPTTLPASRTASPPTGLHANNQNQSNINFVNRRPDYFNAVVSGVTSINNNNKKLAPCVSIAEPEVQKEVKRPFSAYKESICDEDRLRSVSNSSDTVPPSALYRARINHQDAPPPSPFPPLLHAPFKQVPYKAPTPPTTYTVQAPVSPTNSTQSLATIPISQVDVSVPPPLPLSAPDSPHSTKTQDSSSSQGITFSSLRGDDQRIFKGRPPRSPRRSISELTDAPSPRPVQYKHKFSKGIKMNMCSTDDVFK